jgi:hypothetical protein
MESPVDRVENAARTQPTPDRVRRTAESAREKDDKFTKVLRETMDEDSQQKRKQPRKDDELLLSQQVEETHEPDETDSVPEEPADEESSETSDKDQPDRVESIDLTA